MINCSARWSPVASTEALGVGPRGASPLGDVAECSQERRAGRHSAASRLPATVVLSAVLLTGGLAACKPADSSLTQPAHSTAAPAGNQAPIQTPAAPTATGSTLSAGSVVSSPAATATAQASAPAAASALPALVAGLTGIPVPPAPLRQVGVSTTQQLTAALANARPGDLIQLADGQYSGHFVANRAATAKAPITVRGSRNAVLDGGSINSGYVFHLDNADYWRLEGFTVQDGQKGVMTDQTSGAVITGLLVRNIGDEGIHLRNFSTDNIVAGSTVSGTGRKDPGFGEGIYIGSAESNWAKFSGGKPDNSDRNQIIGNAINGVTAEAVDIKEATTGGVLRSNTFDGSAITGDNYADSWVDVKGNNWLIEGNVGVNSPKDGIQTHVVVDGWGMGNIITGNKLDVRGPGFGVSVDKPDKTRNTVSCTNTVTAAASGLFNVPCAR